MEYLKFEVAMPTRADAPKKARRPRGARPSLDLLERRDLMAGAAPTDYEQLMLALVNRARANPAAEGRRLQELSRTDPTIANAVKGWDVDAFVNLISSYPSLPPLAFNARLIEAARTEARRMVDLNRQDHSPNGFLTDPNVATASDGKTYYDVSRASWATGENIFAFSANVVANSPADYVEYFHAGFNIDWGNPDFGHLKNELAPGPSTATADDFPFSEIGIGLLTDVAPTAAPDPNPPNAGLNVGPAVVAQEYGWRSTNRPILTGMFFDDRDFDNFYDPGEGLGGVVIKAVGRKGQGTFETTTWASGGYSLPLPAGTYDVTASGGALAGTRFTVATLGKDNVGWDVAVAANVRADVPLTGDFDGDGKADLAVYDADTFEWRWLRSSDGVVGSIVLGQAGDIPVPGRYDGGTTSLPAVYRPSTGQWIVAGAAGLRAVAFGAPGVDVPEPGDYDGDGKADYAVYRPTTGKWIVMRSSDGAIRTTALGKAKIDQPVPADYDGDGKTDFAVYRSTTGQWIYKGSRKGRVQTVVFGKKKVDQPVPGDYNGDGKADFALYRPTTGQWLVRGATAKAVTTVSIGAPGLDMPKPADYDGDRRADVALFRPSTGFWTVIGSTAGASSTPFGEAGTARTPATLLGETRAVPPTWLGWTPSPGAKVEIGRPARRGSNVPRGPGRSFA